MGARCQCGCDEKRNREHAERKALNYGNREVPAIGTLRGVGGEAFLPYPISWKVGLDDTTSAQVTYPVLT